MDRETLKRKLNEATATIRAFRGEQMTKQASPLKRLLEQASSNELDATARELIKEAATMLLPSGTPCPRCGGSGSI